LRVAVHRLLDELVNIGLAEDKIGPGGRGLPIRYVRQADSTKTKTEREDVPSFAGF
jgi:hypothetical protein